jgi:hypothetical protein
VDLNRVAERVDCGVESLSAASAGFIVDLGGHESDQLVQVIAGGGQDGMVGVGTDPEHQSFAVGIQEPNPAQCCSYLLGDDDLVDPAGEGEPSPAQIEGRIGPVADDALVVADAGLPPDRAAGSVRSMTIRPGQRRLAGRRRHDIALSQAVPASSAVATRTMLLRYRPIVWRVAGLGNGAGR